MKGEGNISKKKDVASGRKEGRKERVKKEGRSGKESGTGVKEGWRDLCRRQEVRQVRLR